MTKRALCLTVVFLVFRGWLEVAARPVEPPVREPLAALPFEIGAWRGRSAPPLDPRVREVLGASEYVNRLYSNTEQPSMASVYIGYHASQRQGASIHSPMNCLPGAGWLPASSERIAIADRRTGASVTVNKVVIQKGDERQIALYWYQSQGRIVASEYVSKGYLFLDALRSGRTDAALVRVIVPVASGRERSAQEAAEQFAGELLPVLRTYLPE